MRNVYLKKLFSSPPISDAYTSYVSNLCLWHTGRILHKISEFLSVFIHWMAVNNWTFFKRKKYLKKFWAYKSTCIPVSMEPSSDLNSRLYTKKSKSFSIIFTFHYSVHTVIPSKQFCWTMMGFGIFHRSIHIQIIPSVNFQKLWGHWIFMI